MNALAATEPPETARPIAVMVVDDSAVVRGLISRQIEAQPDMTVVGSASDGRMAIAELKRREVDLIVLDIEMPVMDGLTALPHLFSAKPGVKVLIASTLTRRNAEISMKALQLGAADYLCKPDSLVAAEEFNRDLIAKIRAVGRKPAGMKPLSGSALTRPGLSTVARANAMPHLVRPQVIAIGGSTGAPPAMTRIFEALKGHVEQPILITQHMPATFTGLLAEQLSRSGGRPCYEAHDGEVIAPGRAYVAPGGWHMTVVREGGAPTLHLNQEAPENFCRPAVDPMLRSLAHVYGAGVFAVILTGMGTDGLKGCEAVHAAGGRFIAQDEASSVVWGMPGAAAKTGLAERIVPLDDIASYIAQAASIRA